MYNIYYLVIILYIIIILISDQRYYYLLPTIIIYPNNNNESKLVEEKSNERTNDDILFFKKTDLSVSYAFLNETHLTYQKLEEMFLPYNFIILFFKYIINRARPYQVNRNIKILNSKTGNTPSFPAGHTFQAYILAKKLSKIHPEKKELFYTIAERCNNVRIKAGIHYPSDGEFSKKLVNLLF